MNLSDYPRPERDNGRGLHWSASVYHPTELDDWMRWLTAMHIRWLKVLDDGGGSSLRLCGRLLDEGIMPIVRLYRYQQNPGHIGGREIRTIKDLVKLGVRYIETNNEPDLQVEWSIPRPLKWMDIVVDDWLYDAAKCLDAGALPAVPALSVGRKDNLIQAIVDKGGRDLLLAGSWVAIHNYALNHPLDYPDDDVNQRGTPLTAAEYAADGTWAWDNIPLETINMWRWQDKNPGATILDDPSCFRSFEFANHQVIQALGVPLPIISTEGGVVMGWRDDRRYPRITPRLHLERTLAIFHFVQTSAPEYFFAVCPWLIANFLLGHYAPGWESQCWFTHWWDQQFGLNGRLPTVDAVAALPTVSRQEKQGPRHSVVRGDVEAMRAVGGLRVTLRGEGFSAATSTDADGRFVFSGLGPGSYTLQAGGLLKAGLQVDGTNTLVFSGLRPPLPTAPELLWDRRLLDMRVMMTPAEATAGATIWRLVQAHVLDRAQAGVGGMIYIDVLDELGRPLAGQEVILSWPTGLSRKATEAREHPAHGAEFPIDDVYNPAVQPGAYSAWVDGLPSDRVTGLGLPLGQDVSFVLVFRRGPAPGAGGSIIEGTIEGQSSSIVVTLYLPDNTTLTTHSDGQGHYAFVGLAPGSYDLEIAGQGIVGRGLTVDGTNALIFDYRMPAQMSTLRGKVIGGQAGLDVILRSSSGEERRTTVTATGDYAFTLLPAGVYSVTVGAQTATGLVLTGLNTLDVPPLDVRPRLSTVSGRVQTPGGRALPDVAVTLTGPIAGETRSGSDGGYQFSHLLLGAYVVRAGDVSQDVTVDGYSQARADLVIPLPEVEKVIPFVLLLGPAAAMGTRVNLRLAQRYIRHFGPTVSFRVEEAEHAHQVLIVGDLQAVSEADEARLREAGCQVARIGGTPYAVENALAHLLAAGDPLPKSRTAVVLSRRRGGDRP